MPELSHEQHRAVMEARSLALDHLAQRWPDTAVPLFVTACMGAVRDMLRDPAIATDLVPLINAELQDVGYAVLPSRRH